MVIPWKLTKNYVFHAFNINLLHSFLQFIWSAARRLVPLSDINFTCAPGRQIKFWMYIIAELVSKLAANSMCIVHIFRHINKTPTERLSWHPTVTLTGPKLSIPVKENAYWYGNNSSIGYKGHFSWSWFC